MKTSFALFVFTLSIAVAQTDSGSGPFGRASVPAFPGSQSKSQTLNFLNNSQPPSVFPETPADRFDFGRVSKQGDLNEYRIGKLEEETGGIKDTLNTLTGTVTGAKWAAAVAIPIFVGMLALVLKFLGKHIAAELVGHYAKKQDKPLLED